MVNPYMHRYPSPPDMKAPEGTLPFNITQQRSSGNHGNFDSNMVVILAALLCALLCTLGLNSIIRCALRCSRRYTGVATPTEAVIPVTKTGLKKRALRQIPVEVYGAGVKIPATECPICLGDFMDGEKLRVLPKCNHGFHVKCIDTWLLSHTSCPTCRHSLIESSRGNDIGPGAVPSTETGSGGHEVVVIVDHIA